MSSDNGDGGNGSGDCGDGAGDDCGNGNSDHTVPDGDFGYCGYTVPDGWFIRANVNRAEGKCCLQDYQGALAD